MSSKLFRGIAGAVVGVMAWAAPALAATSGSQRFTLLLREGSDATSCTLIASGPISGVGTCGVDEGEDGDVTHVVLPTGTFDLVVTTVTQSRQANSTVCVFQFTTTETFTISGGTGSYANAAGAGTSTSRGIFTSPHTPTGCDRSEATGVVIGHASGTASV